jgi:predicted esterase
MNEVERVRKELSARRLVLAGYSAGSFLALEAVKRGTTIDGLVIASTPFAPGEDAAVMPPDMAARTLDTVQRVFGPEVPRAECQCGHQPMYVIYGRQDIITAWSINRPAVTQCARTGPTTLALVQGEHEPSACVNNESLQDFLRGLDE